MITYKDSGVDVERGYEAVKLMKKNAMATFDKNVLGGLGSFGGFYSIADYKYEEPVLVSGTDGVGTKLKIAFLMDKHDTIGIDAVAMCADDVVCQGAKPLFFLDYLATGALEPQKAADIVKGVADGCKMAGCALIGGETAEMPGFYPAGEYDLAGFCVGIVDKKAVINGANIKAGDVLIGLASSGVHSNGYSLVRRLLVNKPDDVFVYSDELGKTVGEELLTPTRIYAGNLMKLVSEMPIKGIAHITGGGFIENIPRMFPEGVGCDIKLGTWEVLPIFNMLNRLGGLDDAHAYNTFNMGIGMVLAVDPTIADKCVAALSAMGEKASIIGTVREGEGVTLIK
ncbi:MAG: phosphoribosylformylglycinamidine cyclo-ligase [Clostridiales bacterium]|nr:phosphoribosylformylglycinamidine cyclo-ligase [Clostridiales bacterium]